MARISPETDISKPETDFSMKKGKHGECDKWERWEREGIDLAKTICSKKARLAQELP